MHLPTDRIIHATDFVTPVVEHWLEREVLYSVQCSYRIIVSRTLLTCLSPDGNVRQKRPALRVTDDLIGSCCRHSV